MPYQPRRRLLDALLLSASLGAQVQPAPPLPLRHPAAVPAGDAKQQDQQFMADRLGQWASEAVASSEYSKPAWSAAQATGAPDVVQHGDDAKSWAPAAPDRNAESLTLTFARPVTATAVRIRQSYNPGAIVRVRVDDGAGTGWVVFEGPDRTTYPPMTIGWLVVTFAPTPFHVQRVIVELRPAAVPGYNEIDAVQLVAHDPAAAAGAERPAGHEAGQGLQPTGDNALIAVVRRIGAEGLGPDQLAPATGWPFRPSGDRIFVGPFVAAFLADPADRPTLEQGIREVLDRFDAMARSIGQEHDPATAVAFSIAVLHGVANAQETDDESFLALAPRLRARLASVAATDRQKQQCYEWALCMSAVVVCLAEGATDAGKRRNLEQLARTQLERLIGAAPAAIRLRGRDVAIRGSGKPAAGEPAASRTTGTQPERGAAAPSTSLAWHVPAGWVEREGWWCHESLRGVVTERSAQEVTSAFVRMLPAIPAGADPAAALRTMWRERTPAELAGKATTMVLRRYVGDQLRAWFVSGRGVERNRRTDTVFTMMLVDCGATWQPLVCAQTFEERGYRLSDLTERHMADSSFAGSWAAIEGLLATFRCPAARGRPLATPAELAGNWSFGSNSTAQWVNVYNGATAMTFVSGGGDLDLAADGTFTYAFTSAIGTGGTLVVRKAKGHGSWAIEGDRLICRFTAYDQGDGHVATDNTYRIGGLGGLDDGTRVAILLSRPGEVPTSTSFGDSGAWFSTRK